MHTSIASLLAIMATVVLSACATPPKTTPIGEIVSQSRAGMAPDQLISRVRASKTSYALRGSDFAKLAKHGVPEPVLDELQQSFVNSVDMLTRFSALGESYGGCDWCYPQPLNLAELDEGGTGMSGQKNLGSIRNYARPRGIPEWVPASPRGASAPLVTSSDVSQWMQAGIPADESARRVRSGRFAHVFADNPGVVGTVRTHLGAGLKGSELATLATQGASDDTLDALQEIFLAEYIEFARHRYQNWGKGPNP